jgi:hypothetical protein
MSKDYRHNKNKEERQTTFIKKSDMPKIEKEKPKDKILPPVYTGDIPVEIEELGFNQDEYYTHDINYDYN